MSELFKDVPEFVETEIGESLAARTEILASFRELGPPDLCHVVKSYGSKGAQKDLGSYHYCSGVEASSSASVAAYLNSLQFHIDDSPAWFGKGSGWRVRTGTYCCFNAFSRVDIRVEVRIPGGVDAYVVDRTGNRHEPTPEIWQETFLSALLRAIRFSDDESYRLAGYRKLDPITTVEGEQRFLRAAQDLFFQGCQLGTDPEVQISTVVSNHLTAGVLKYFSDSFRLEHAAKLFETMAAQEPEVAALLAQSYIGMNEELKAIQVLHSALETVPRSYPVLLTQVDFLLSKGKAKWALPIAQQAVNSAPGEFLTWAKLTQTYIDLGDFGNALLSLNSCPMFTFNERDLHHMPPAARTHLPIKKLIAAADLFNEESSRDIEADAALLRLPAPGLRGTFKKAYRLLTQIVAKIGWDELLKTRSTVFVMEEEYRQHKDKDKESESHKENGNGTTATPTATATEGEADEDASTRGVHSPEGISRPGSVAVPPEDEPAINFNNKRLCERFLDHLFLVLYEDLRVYTIWRAEISHFQTQHMSYKKTGTEWEILGELALRLHHKEEAKDAFQRCLDQKFSARALLPLLEMYAADADLSRTLNAAIRLTAYHYRWYMESAYPSAIAHAIYTLGKVHGLSKIKNTLLSMNLPEGIFPIMMNYIKYAETFHVEGSEY